MARIQFFISSLALISLLTLFHPLQSQSARSTALFDKLAAAVLRSESQSLLTSLTNIMAKPEMQKNPGKLRSEIVRLLKHPKFQEATEGRKTVKAIKLPPAIVKILNAKIPVKTKKQILDNVLRRLPMKKKNNHLQTEAAGNTEKKASVRDDKSVKFPEDPVAPVAPAAPVHSGYLAANIAPPQSDSVYFDDLPSYGADTDTGSQPSGSGQTTMNNQISQPRPGSSTSSQQVSEPPNRAGTGGTSGATGGQEAGEDNNYGFPLRLGRAGVDFPIFSRETIPATSFSCSEKVEGGYFADLEAGCQVYHVCVRGRKFTELCPNGTVYDQGQFTCSSWRKVDCSEQGLQLSNQLIEDFVVERKFVTENLDSTNPEKDLPWRNRNT